MSREAQNVPTIHVAAILRAGTSLTCAPDTVIYRQAEPAEQVFYIEEGLVKLDVASSQGKRAVIGLLGPDSFFGEGCLAGQGLRNATATALMESRLVQVRKPAMLRLLRADPTFAQQFVRHLLRRTTRIEEDLIDLLVNTTEKRLARALLLLANLGGEPQALLGRVNQQTLAEIVGTTRPRVSHFIGKFRKRGYVSAQGPLRVHSTLVKVMLDE